MKLTQNEKLIYAAAYVAHLDVSNPPPYLLVPGKQAEWEEWNQAQIAHAIEWASSAVEMHRDAAAKIGEGWEGDEVAEHYKQMAHR